MSKQQPYLVTARKYRPALFKELVAQEHVSETLKNALQLDRLAHAYLFSGPRGVGKTTAARILAKAINCTTPLAEREDQAEPCRTCASCQSFEEGRNLNIIEFDAASNNSVDDIRELRDKVRVPPQGGRKKVYIIDEVHMLSNAAFNALLKTLEEPPPHVLFIFATTEPHKVLPTILSRCQRFDFRRIPVVDIVARLREICEEEGIAADDASLMLLARKGDGALRDALSAFDQAVSLCGTGLKYGELAQALGVVDVDLYFEVTRYVQKSNSAGMLQLVERIVREGYDVQEFLSGLAEHLRNLLVAVTMQEPSLIAATEALRERYVKQAASFAEPDLLRLLMIASDTQDAVKGSTQPRLKLEMALLKMVSLARAGDLQEVIEKVKRLEERTRGKENVDLPGANSSPDNSGAAPASADDSKPSYPQESSPKPSLQDQVREPELADENPSEEGETAPSVSEREQVNEKNETPGASEKKTPDQPAPPASGSPAQQGAGHSNLFSKPALNKNKKRSASSSGSSGTTEARHAGDGAAVAAPAPPSTSLQDIKSAWPDYVQHVKRKRIQVGALLQHCQPTSLRGDTLSVAVPDPFHQRLLRNQQALLLRHLNEMASADLSQFDFAVQDDLEVSDQEETAGEVDPYEYMQKKRQENPVVRAIFEHFGGELVW